jgi:hypothetical protein
MLGHKFCFLAATAVLLASPAAAEVDVIYGGQATPACAITGCSVEQAGVTIIYGTYATPRPVAVEAPPPEPYYVVNQGPTYEQVIVPYNDTYAYPYLPAYGYGYGYRPFGKHGYQPFGPHKFKPQGMHRRSQPHFGRPHVQARNFHSRGPVHIRGAGRPAASRHGPRLSRR